MQAGDSHYMHRPRSRECCKLLFVNKIFVANCKCGHQPQLLTLQSCLPERPDHTVSHNKRSFPQCETTGWLVINDVSCPEKAQVSDALPLEVPAVIELAWIAVILCRLRG